MFSRNKVCTECWPALRTVSWTKQCTLCRFEHYVRQRAPGIQCIHYYVVQDYQRVHKKDHSLQVLKDLCNENDRYEIWFLILDQCSPWKKKYFMSSPMSKDLNRGVSVHKRGTSKNHFVFYQFWGTYATKICKLRRTTVITTHSQVKKQHILINAS